MANVMRLPETAMVKLWLRASEVWRHDGIIDDPMAINLVDPIDYDFSQFKFKLSTNRQDLAL